MVVATNIVNSRREPVTYYHARGVEYELARFADLFEQQRDNSDPQAVLCEEGGFHPMQSGLSSDRARQIAEGYLTSQPEAKPLPSNQVIMTLGSIRGEVVMFGGQTVASHGFEHGAPFGYFEIFYPERFAPPADTEINAPGENELIRVYDQPDLAEFLLGVLKIAGEIRVLVASNGRSEAYTEERLIKTEEELRELEIADGGIGTKAPLFKSE